MKIDDDHLYHGAALTQIAEDPRFTAINALKLAGKTIHIAYRINDNIAVYFKYSTKPTPKSQEYVFNFTIDDFDRLSKISETAPNTFIALICVKDREICCLSFAELLELHAKRKKASGTQEEILTVLVTVPAKKSLRVYVNTPGKRGSVLGKEKIVNRKAFPGDIFSSTVS
jgi:hypothetical protein